MVDFKKRLGVQSIQKKVNPIEIYESLDRRSETGPLRPVQERILTEWWNDRRKEKDIILKLHTGQGKTIIGLLILQSRLNEGRGPCLYVCPNIYLVKQVCQQAERFGIPYTNIGKDKSLPDDFLNSKCILVTHVQKIFNGLSKFGFGGKFIAVDSLILDDSHACIDAISEAFKIKIKRDHTLYDELIRLFKGDLIEQGEGSFLEIESGEYNTLLPVPYWSWQDKKTEALRILKEYVDDDKVKFTWPLIKDAIENCQCLISGESLEISTFLNPVYDFGTFTKANHRILMSATTQNDSFFIKGLGLSSGSVKNPLTSNTEKWWGEKMVLIPSLIDGELHRNYIINKFAKPIETFEPGIVAITTSLRKTGLYEHLGAIIADSDTIFEEVNKLKTGKTSKTVVMVNRYDGVDLPDAACRILILDSCPYAESLTERYEEYCRSTSDIINTKIAQKIEQGLGRSVRGEKDYSVILLIGSDLVKFVKSSSSNKFFSSQTRKHIETGFEIAELSIEEDVVEGGDNFRVIGNLIKQCLIRDDGWKEFYRDRMDSIQEDSYSDNQILEIFELERKAEEAFFKKDAEDAISCIQEILDDYVDDEIEKGWYLQTLARYKYRISKTDSIKIQKSAFNCNTQLLKPKEGIVYKKLEYINENRVRRIREWASSYEDYEQLMISVNNILSNLSFGEPSEKFELALQDLGKAIGFLSQRPDKEFKKGPDNIWCGENDEYFIFECKNGVKKDRKEITKTETGQMNNHSAWFEKEYKLREAKRIMIIDTKTVSSQGGFTHAVEIMKEYRLDRLKNNIADFFKEFKDYRISEIGDAKIQEWIENHKLDVKSLKTEYSEKYYQKT